MINRAKENARQFKIVYRDTNSQSYKLNEKLQNNNILLQNEINLANHLQYAMIMMRVKEDFQWLIQKII